MARYAFGIDLAGYTTGTTAVAVMITTGSQKQFCLLRNSAFSKVRRSDANLREIVSEECRDLKAMNRLGPVAIDVPIDLQTLEKPENATVVWQLYKRAIDQAFNAMPTLADRIGAPYARMKAVFALCGGTLCLGRDIFETYPKASLQMLHLPFKGYKGALPAHGEARRVLCDQMKWCHLSTDHDLDALLCAATAGATPDEQLSGDELESLIARKLPSCPNCKPPQGFVLLQRLPPPIAKIEVVEFSDWIGAHS